MARVLLVVVLAAVLVFLAPAVTSSCDDALPTELAGNYSGMACSPVWNSFVLRYAQDGDNVLRVVLSAKYNSGWVGMGFSNDGMMAGSSAMVGWVGEKGQPHIKQFALNGKAPSLAVADKGSRVSNNVDYTVVVKQDKIYLAFQLGFSSPLKQQQVLFAISSAIPVNDRLAEHQDKTSMNFDFTTGEQRGARLEPAVLAGSPDLLSRSRLPRLQTYPTAMESSRPRLLRSRRGSRGPHGNSSGSSSSPNDLKRIHGAVNLFAWGVLLPIGAIVARYCRGSDPLWFHLHVCIQFMGFILGLAGVLAGLSLYRKIQADVPAHRGIGISVLVLGILQILALFQRPNKDTKFRKYWNWCHHWTGRLVLFLAAVNIVVGMKVGGVGNSWKIGYGINLAIRLITIITLEFLVRKRWKNNGNPTTTY